MVTHLGRLHSARAELGPGPGLPGGRGMDRMTPGSSVLPASSGCRSQSAASASSGSAQRSPSWWCGGRPHAGRRTAAAPRTGEEEKQKARRFRPEKRQGVPGPNRLPVCGLEAPPVAPPLSIKSIPADPGLCLLRSVHRLCTRVGLFFLDLVFCSSPLIPGIHSQPVTLWF